MSVILNPYLWVASNLTMHVYSGAHQLCELLPYTVAWLDCSPIMGGCLLPASTQSHATRNYSGRFLINIIWPPSGYLLWWLYTRYPCYRQSLVTTGGSREIQPAIWPPDYYFNALGFRNTCCCLLTVYWIESWIWFSCLVSFFHSSFLYL